MAPFFLLLLIACTICLPISILSRIIPAPNSKRDAPLLLSAFSSSSLGIPIDPNFSIDGSVSDVELNKTSCLITALQFTGDLASKDWSSTIPTLQSPLSRKYPGVVIIGGPEIPATRIPISWLIWGLTTSIKYLIERNRYVESNFDLIYDDRIAGAITFHRIQALPASAPSSALTAPPSNSSIASIVPVDAISGSEAIGITEEVTLQVTPLDDSQSLNPNHIWLNLFLALQMMAFRDSSSRFSLLTTDPHPRSTVDITIDRGKGAGMPRQSPPFLLYSTVITSIRLLAEWMIQTEGGYREVEFTIASSGVPVGAGIVKSTNRKRLSNSDLSTS